MKWINQISSARCYIFQDILEKCKWFLFCYINVDSSYSKNVEITSCEHIQNGQNFRPKNT